MKDILNIKAFFGILAFLFISLIVYLIAKFTPFIIGFSYFEVVGILFVIFSSFIIFDKSYEI